MVKNEELSKFTFGRKKVLLKKDCLKTIYNYFEKINNIARDVIYLFPCEWM